MGVWRTFLIFPVMRVMYTATESSLLPICRGELFVSVARLMSNVREAGESGSEELMKYAPPLPQQFCDSCMVVKKNPDRKIYIYIYH